MVENLLRMLLALQRGESAAAGLQPLPARGSIPSWRRLARDPPLHGLDAGAVDKGDAKWSGIAALGTKLFAAPSFAPVLLVVDTLAGLVLGNSTDAVDKGDEKWRGIAALGTKLFAAPYHAPVLVCLSSGWHLYYYLYDAQAMTTLGWVRGDRLGDRMKAFLSLIHI